MIFSTEPEPPRGVYLPVLPGIGRVVAPNPGPTTYHGTNTYLIEHSEGIFILDPGPDNADHIAAVIAAIKGPPAGILASHSHQDHIGALPALKAILAVPTYAFEQDASTGFVADHAIADGDVVAGLTALHTPGHASDHLCYCRPDQTVFTGDHIMGWSSTAVAPPHGNMAAYFASLQLMIDRSDKALLPGHGPPLYKPLSYVVDLLERRQDRENEILLLLNRNAMSLKEISGSVYHQQHPKLALAAERNVNAHLIKLQAEGKVREANELWYLAR